MLDINASYHSMYFQEKLVNQTWENVWKPSFGPDFGPFWPKFGPPKVVIFKLISTLLSASMFLWLSKSWVNPGIYILTMWLKNSTTNTNFFLKKKRGILVQIYLLRKSYSKLIIFRVWLFGQGSFWSTDIKIYPFATLFLVNKN